MHQRTIAQLRRELEEEKVQHAKMVDELKDKWESRLREAKEDYRRMVVSHCVCVCVCVSDHPIKGLIQLF